MGIGINITNSNRIPEGIANLQNENICVFGYSDNSKKIVLELKKYDIIPVAILVSKEYYGYHKKNNITVFNDVHIFEFEEYTSNHYDFSLLLSLDPYRYRSLIGQFLENPNILRIYFFYGCDILYGNDFEFIRNNKIKYIDNYYLGVLQRGLDEKYYREHLSEFEETFAWLQDDKSRITMKCYLDGHINVSQFPMLSVWKQGDDSDQYFPYDIFELRTDEVFVDCGAYDGDTFYSFVSKTESYGKYYIIEPDVRRFARIAEIVREYSNIEIINMATWERKCELSFSMDNDCGEVVVKNGGSQLGSVNADTLDNMIDTPPTFIKMDIEGAELKSLYGATRLIEKYSPILAICVYHKREDLITIPQFIKSIHPGYRLYLRGYFPYVSEVVLYAIPEGRAH